MPWGKATPFNKQIISRIKEKRGRNSSRFGIGA
jgi:hypothetical protein